MLQDIHWLNELFLTTGIWGLFGTFAVIFIGYFLAKKTDRPIALLWFIVESVITAKYLELVSETPDYWLNIILLLLGSVFLCLVPAVLKKK